MKSRIKEFKSVQASTIKRNPNNWRTHPAEQQTAMRAVLEEVGNIDVLKVVERDGGYLLVDGHLRQEIFADEEVQVAVLDLNDEEVSKALLTFDPVSTLAQKDDAILEELISQVEIDKSGLESLVNSLIDDSVEIKDQCVDREFEESDSAKVGVAIGDAKFWVERSEFDAWQVKHQREPGLTKQEWTDWLKDRLFHD